ncbi:MAG: hypothetical protein HN742_04990 [Lentisphaerae bacterium]|nr:hypothetical protein [Lentisphaerota bacterium]MBT4819817.1 hypothetical protein [Lentisphaerota bacterium]MBT5610827.1 hypothetical protein [Lentisphaerota bacterium]MBT7053741.1 hypothetical protein [Lentisphaerota bacterium]MBT7841202.1 hypothetical protein [Lentisphaerota bacterium]
MDNGRQTVGLTRREALRSALRGVTALGLVGLGVWLRRGRREANQAGCSDRGLCSNCRLYREGCTRAGKGNGGPASG